MLPSQSFLSGWQGMNLSHLEITLPALQKTYLGETQLTYLQYKWISSSYKEANSVHGQFALNRFSFQIRSRPLESCTHLARAIKGNCGFITTELRFNWYKWVLLEAECPGSQFSSRVPRCTTNSFISYLPDKESVQSNLWTELKPS